MNRNEKFHSLGAPSAEIIAFTHYADLWRRRCPINRFSLIAGDQPEMPPAIPLTAAGPQPMGALQHETMMHQQIAAAVAAQQNMAAAENLQGPRAPQPAGMSPQQQQQVLAAQLQMQVQQSK